ncbi:DUF3829 domain-containing protein [Pseudomonas sp. F01002]|uniref:DUF3829 domain-containing protein n=1 Tax=Pseudomonas sp. F01002 TaxID=2555724 RepID=UPI00106D1F69|nr:DUF3829 domain-containing protein [Pseudomonas sp. F01002]TFB37921.1 DUF3829 domain-containing protein [Pseudomonas sp. F01002]
MNKRVLAVAITAVLTVTFLGMLREHQGTLLTPIQRWLRQPDLAEREKANALRPLIACLNSVDSRWRHAYANYLNRDRKVDPTLKERFPEDFDQMVSVREQLNYPSVHDAYSCQLNAMQKDNLQKSAPELLALQNRFETSLSAANEAAGLFDFFSARPTYSVSPADKAERDSLFIPLVKDYLNASDQLRRELDAEDLDLRQVQLEQLKTRDQLKYAHILTYMLQARTLMLTLDNRVRERTFNASDLSDATLMLQQAWDDGTRYMQANPATSNADYPENIWNYVRSPGKNYLDAVNRLRDDWAANASPQQLSDDFERIGRRYDQLIEVYNDRVNPLF